MLRWYYRDDDGNITEITERFDLDGDAIQLQTFAEEQSVSTSRVKANDPDNDFAISGHRLFYAVEDLATYYDRIWTGYTAQRVYRRGESFRTGGAHEVEIDLSDLNTILGRRVMVGADCNRPEETDVERMQWLEATAELSLIDDTTYLSTDDPVDMDAVDYRGQYAADIIRDCMDQSGKNCFVYEIDDGGHKYSLFYGDGGSDVDVLSSDLRITNNLADVTADAGEGDPGAGQAWTWAGSLDTELQRDPSRVFSGVYGNFDGGAVYRQDSGTIDAFASRDTITSWPNVKSRTRAGNRAVRYLNTIDTEEDIITTTIEVTPEHVNDARAGERIQCLFTHLPGYQYAYQWMRILNRTVEFVTPERYKITYTLSASPGRPPIECAAVVADATADIWAGPEFFQVDDPPGIVIAPGITVSVPSVVFCLWAAVNNDTSMGGVPAHGGPGTQTVGDDFTEIGDSRETWNTDYPTLALMGYQALASGAAGTMSVSWSPTSGSGASSHRAIAAAIPTAATSPVQTATQVGTGNTATLAAPPTLGNILVMGRFAETSGFSPPDPPTGWTRMVGPYTFHDEIGYQSIELYCRCVIEGEDAIIGVGNATKSHWAFVSEWELV